MYRFPQPGFGFLERADVTQGGAEVVEQIGQIGLQPSGFAVGAQSLPRLQRVGMGVTEHLVGLGIVAFGAEGDAAGGHGVGGAAQGQKCVGAVQMV